MTANEKAINEFSTRVRQLILQYKQTKQENEELYALVEKRDQEISRLQDQLRQEQAEYQSLKMAKMIEITDGDLEGAQKRLARLIRDVNKCITLLRE
ncbi:MAG: hypothetical protein J6N73_09665 [Prevotella sp.]|jgi:hypothetical protein|nr:hypothetical protein [Prevotella sp.]